MFTVEIGKWNRMNKELKDILGVKTVPGCFK